MSKEFKPGDRFVIEIAGVLKETDGERCVRLADDCVSSHYMAYRIKGFNTLLFDEFGLNKLEPYCEAVRDSNRKAYDNGVKDGYEKRNAETKQTEYLRGLEDAWDVVRQIENHPDNGGLTNREIELIFGKYYPPHELYDKFTAKFALDAVNNWRMKKNMGSDPEATVDVGDVLESSCETNPGISVLVTSVKYGIWHVVQNDGLTGTISGDQKKYWKKKRVHVAIAPILESLGEDHE